MSKQTGPMIRKKHVHTQTNEWTTREESRHTMTTHAVRYTPDGSFLLLGFIEP